MKKMQRSWKGAALQTAVEDDPIDLIEWLRRNPAREIRHNIQVF